MVEFSGCSLDVVTDSRIIGTFGTGMHRRARFRTVGGSLGSPGGRELSRPEGRV